MKSLTIAGNIGEFLAADFEAGKLFWRERSQSYFPDARSFSTWNSRYAGKEAMTYLEANGYLCGRLFDKPVKAHRAIWAIANQSWPRFIDHINGVRSDNRLCNLREVSVAQNNQNMGVRSDSRTGIPGVCWDTKRAKWMATIAGRHIGRFDDLDAAIAARLTAQAEAGFHENHGRVK